jgi:hypothetical protein
LVSRRYSSQIFRLINSRLAPALQLSGKSANGNSGKVCYYEHITLPRRQSEQFEKLDKHEPHRVPAAKIEPIVWQQVRRFIERSEFTNEMWMKAKSLHESIVEGDEGQRLEKRRATILRQVETLAERIAILSEEIDPAPLLAQLAKLQAGAELLLRGHSGLVKGKA